MGFDSFGYGSGYGPGYGPGYGYGDESFSQFGGAEFGGEGVMAPFENAITGIGGAILAIVMIFYFLMIAFAIVSYVFQSISFYTIAKRRGIQNPWLAWLPVGECWILGSISDQYQYLVKNKVTNRRKVLLALSLASLITALPVIIFAVVGLVIGALEGMILGVIFGYLLMLVLILALAVFRYIALYDLYMSCAPDNGVLFLVLSIVFGVTTPFFLFANRKLDGGMPPRKQPVEAPAEPVADDEDFE